MSSTIVSGIGFGWGTIDISHTTTPVSAAYNFTRSGAGDYSIGPSNLFTYVGAGGTPKNLRATVEGIAAVKLSGNLAVSRVHDKRTLFPSCSATMQSKLKTAIVNAQSLAANAYAYLVSISSGTYWYLRWFGAYDPSRLNIVRNHFELISSRDFTGFTYDCSCTTSDYLAYVCPYILQS
jgi:peptidyl-Lys metalloendopeptidase